MSASAGDNLQPAPPAIVKWAQRSDRIYLTICLEDVQEKQLDLTETRLTFSAVGGTDRKLHAISLDFNKEVDPQESRHLVNGREVVMSIRKKEPGPYWPRLTADSGKRHWLKTDFDRWVDEDDLDAGAGGMGGGEGDEKFESMLSQMGGGFGGYGGGGPGGFGGGEFGDENGEDDDLDIHDEAGDGAEDEEEQEGTAATGEGAKDEPATEAAAPAAAAAE